jgi:hypothetical protein
VLSFCDRLSVFSVPMAEIGLSIDVRFDTTLGAALCGFAASLM